MKHSLRFIASATALGAAASPAFAHEGHETTGLLAGMLHPVTGADHLLVTLGLGLLAGLVSTLQVGGKPAAGAAGRLALAVVLGACAGVMLVSVGLVGQTLSALAEPAAALGLLVIALMLAGAERLSPRTLAVAAAAVSLPHGLLHGLESQGPAFLAGLVLTSLMLFAAGSLLGRQIASRGVQSAMRLRHLTAAGFAGLGMLLVGMPV